MIHTTKATLVKGEIPSILEDGALINIVTKDVNPYTHGFHKYPSKFIPQIPRWALKKYLKPHSKKNILDPFCGSGTTLVESLLQGHNAIGVDIDPLSTLISKVKTTPLELELLSETNNWLRRTIRRRKTGKFLPETHNINHWFSKNAIEQLSKIRTVIDDLPLRFGETREVKDIYDFYLICFSSIIRRTSNADNQSQKTYVSHTLPKEPEDALPLFFKRLEFFSEKIIEYSEAVSSDLKCLTICGSSISNMRSLIQNQKVDIAITSPPYIKAIDYLYNQMVELFWVGDLFNLQTQALQNEKKPNYVGTKQIRKSEYEHYLPSENRLSIAELDQNLSEIFQNDQKNGHKHAFITFRYFKELDAHFSYIADVLKPGGHYVMVVGDSSVSGVDISTSRFAIQLAESQGFTLISSWSYKIKNHYMRFDRKGRGGMIKTDWVLEFLLQ